MKFLSAKALATGMDRPAVYRALGPKTPEQVMAKIISPGNWSVEEIMKMSHATQAEVEHALHIHFRPRVKKGQAGPRWNAERNCHLYPFG